MRGLIHIENTKSSYPVQFIVYKTETAVGDVLMDNTVSFNLWGGFAIAKTVKVSPRQSIYSLKYLSS